MPYSDFSLKKAKQDLGITITEQQNVFADIQSVSTSQILHNLLKENIPLARAINTEKARSELIITNILLEVRRLLEHKVSLFSGIEFNVDREKNLNGFCDFILSASQQQLALNSPVVAIVEAKNENIIGGLGQCIAEMFAATLFNQNEGNSISRVYGAVTTGTAWRFIKMQELDVIIDLDEYSIENADKIVGILLAMVIQKA